MSDINEYNSKYKVDGYKEERIKVAFSPLELRRLADKMEEEFPKFLPGDNTRIETYILSHTSPVLMLDVMADQTYFHQKKGGG